MGERFLSPGPPGGGAAAAAGDPPQSPMRSLCTGTRWSPGRRPEQFLPLVTFLAPVFPSISKHKVADLGGGVSPSTQVLARASATFLEHMLLWTLPWECSALTIHGPVQLVPAK